MQRIGHVDALPPGAFDRKIDDITRLRHDAGGAQDVDQRRPDPLEGQRLPAREEPMDSAAGTSWATMAIALALPPQTVSGTIQ